MSMYDVYVFDGLGRKYLYASQVPLNELGELERKIAIEHMDLNLDFDIELVEVD